MPDPDPTIPVPLGSSDERRRAERFGAEMPVRVDGVQGTTQDLSTTGLSFHAQHAYDAGTQVEVVIEYLLDGHHYPLRCQAEVVRSVPDGAGGFTIGARLMPQSQVAPVSLGEEVPAGARQHLRSVD